MNKVGSIIKNGQEVLADKVINFAGDRGSFFVDEKIFEIDDEKAKPVDDIEIIFSDGLRVAIVVSSVQYLATIKSHIIKFIAKSWSNKGGQYRRHKLKINQQTPRNEQMFVESESKLNQHSFAIYVNKNGRVLDYLSRAVAGSPVEVQDSHPAPSQNKNKR